MRFVQRVFLLLFIGLAVFSLTALQFPSSNVTVQLSEWVNQELSSQGDGTGKVEQGIASKTIASATNASPNVYTSTTHGFENGDHVHISGETGSTTANGLRVIAEKTTSTFQLTTPQGVAINTDGTFGGTVLMWPVFAIIPASDEVIELERLNGFAHDASYDSTGYFGIGLLANGVEVRVYTDDVITKTITAAPVKKWLQWALNAGSDAQNGDGGAGVVAQSQLRWSFFKAGSPLKLKGHKGEFLAVIIQDDLSGLLGQEMSVQGIIRTYNF